jgi:hypothetical protein
MLSSRRAVRRTLPALLALLVAACGGTLLFRSCGRSSNAPVVLVSIDTLRADRLPAYGYKGVETPAIERLQRDAIVFENAYSHSPLTFPSHASLLTGLLPPEHGVRNNIGYKLEPKHETLASVLRARGYATGAAVSAFVLRRATGIDQGFDSYDVVVTAAGAKAVGEVQRDGLTTVARALTWLRGVGGRPFFLFVHLYEPHTPWTPPADQLARYGATYEGEIAAADVALGQLLEGLRQLGRYDEALVVLVSDHGEGLDDHGEAEHGILLYREAIHVPLLVKLPRAERGGSRQTALAGLRDVAPTIAARRRGAAQGRPRPQPARGRSAATASVTADPLPADPPRLTLRSLVDARYHLIDGRGRTLRRRARSGRSDVLSSTDRDGVRGALAAASPTCRRSLPKEEREKLMSPAGPECALPPSRARRYPTRATRSRATRAPAPPLRSSRNARTRRRSRPSTRS